MLKTEIGKAAGDIWRFLGENGKVSLTTLPTKTKINSNLTHQAIGWLAREDKIELSKQAKTVYVSLTSDELNNYRQMQGSSCGM